MSDAKSTPSHPLSGFQMQSRRFSHSRTKTWLPTLFPVPYASIRVSILPLMSKKVPAAIHSQSECQRDQQYAKYISLSRLIDNESDTHGTAKCRDVQMNASTLRFAFTHQEKCRHGVKRTFGMASC
ncbi:hypothetical protein [Kosakonia sp. YIM B13611]|uniref:hypothetical protein n=1 Tax=unclassified Kosakonia TaxID=2632876 RepID=UPI003694888C